MSAKNGDKARHDKNRKRVLARRVKIRALVKQAKEGGDAKTATK